MTPSFHESMRSTSEYISLILSARNQWPIPPLSLDLGTNSAKSIIPIQSIPYRLNPVNSDHCYTNTKPDSNRQSQFWPSPLQPRPSLEGDMPINPRRKNTNAINFSTYERTVLLQAIAVARDRLCINPYNRRVTAKLMAEIWRILDQDGWRGKVCRKPVDRSIRTLIESFERQRSPVLARNGGRRKRNAEQKTDST